MREKIQPLDKLDRVIEHIRRMMVMSTAESASKGKLKRGYLSIAVEEKK
jgi:hypothetical protein